MTPASARLPRGAFRGLAHARPLPVQTFALRQDQHLDLTVLYVPIAHMTRTCKCDVPEGETLACFDIPACLGLACGSRGETLAGIH